MLTPTTCMFCGIYLTRSYTTYKGFCNQFRDYRFCSDEHHYAWLGEYLQAKLKKKMKVTDILEPKEKEQPEPAQKTLGGCES